MRTKASKEKQQAWEDIAQSAQDHRDRSLKKSFFQMPNLPDPLPKNVMHIPSTILNEAETEITETSPERLVQLLADGQLTATEVTTAYLRRAAIAQKLVRSFRFFVRSLLHHCCCEICLNPMLS